MHLVGLRPLSEWIWQLQGNTADVSEYWSSVMVLKRYVHIKKVDSVADMLCMWAEDSERLL
jgi:hypothetical protein